MSPIATRAGFPLAFAAFMAATSAGAQQPGGASTTTGQQGTPPLGILRGSGSDSGTPNIQPELPDDGPAAIAGPSTTNYGKPQKRPDPKLKYPGRGKPPARPLPPLEPYATSAQARQKPVQPQSPDQTVVQPQPPTSVAVIPTIPRKSAARPDADPFAPLGIGVGGLRLVPYVETDTGFASNPNGSPTSTSGSWLLRGETGFSVTSDWSRHQLTGSAEFGYNKYFSQPNADRPDGQAKFGLKIDVSHDATADFELRGLLTTQSPGTPGIGVNVTNRPLVATFGATAGGTENLGNLALGLHGTIDRTVNQDGTLSNGAIVDLSNGNYTAFGLQPRIAYQLTPGVIPYVEATVDTRKRDQSVDTLGFARDSSGISARVGTTFELSRILTGQIAAGFAERSYADSRLPGVSAPTVDASLVWTATPLTTATFKAATTINETTVTNSPGYVAHAGSIEISHALFRNLTLSALGSVAVNDYAGVSLHETAYSAGLKLAYNITRSVVVNGSFTHDRLVSTAPGSDYTANVYLLGLKLQR